MIFVETNTFSKLVNSYLSDDDLTLLQSYLFKCPDAGVILRGSGGVRKIRWAPAGHGKRGGVRVIYYWNKPKDKIWLLTIYSKSEQDTIPGYLFRQIVQELLND